MMNTAEAAQRAGVTLRMVQWWLEREMIVCDGNRRRSFDDGQVLRIAIVAELRRRKISLYRIRKLKLWPIAGEYLVTDGRYALWCDPETVIEAAETAPRAVWVISVADLRRRMERANGRK